MVLVKKLSLIALWFGIMLAFIGLAILFHRVAPLGSMGVLVFAMIFMTWLAERWF
jgi:hypothetical protein